MTAVISSVPQGMSILDTDEAWATTVIPELEQRCLELNALALYDEAVTCKRHMMQLREQQERLHNDQRQARHQDEINKLEQQHRQDLYDLHQRWEQEQEGYEAHVAEMLQCLESRQAEELKEYSSKLQKETEPRKPRWSSELLNLRKIYTTLGNQGDFEQAAEVHAKAEKREAKELAVWKAKRDEKIAALERNFTSKQGMEAAGLAKRFQLGRAEQERARKHETERLRRRYNHLKQGLETQFKISTQRSQPAARGKRTIRRSSGDLSGLNTPRNSQKFMGS